MTDGQGRTVDFKNTIIIMTSNVGSHWIQEMEGTSRLEMEEKITESLRAQFKPEFLNRVDETIIFQNLTPEQIGKIVDIQMKMLSKRLSEQHIELDLSDRAISLQQTHLLCRCVRQYLISLDRKKRG